MANEDLTHLRQHIALWSKQLGFQAVGYSDIDLSLAEPHLLNWLANGFHGQMDYMARHGTRRSRPADLLEGTVSVISVRMDYWPAHLSCVQSILEQPHSAYISRYALGRDYHKLMRKRLQQLAQKITIMVGEFGYRVFCDSAPVLEKAIAEKAQLGWIGKHTLLLNSRAGSWFFLGEIYLDFDITKHHFVEQKSTVAHCGSCTRCIQACPTKAIIAPFRLDARLCISYLTIEHFGSIPTALRSLIGNRIFGCDDCQLVCPWNRFATPTPETDFTPRHGLDAAQLSELALWDEATFLQKTEGTVLRRLGHERWLRNIAVALGNAPITFKGQSALQHLLLNHSELIREHANWALNQSIAIALTKNTE